VKAAITLAALSILAAATGVAADDGGTASYQAGVSPPQRPPGAAARRLVVARPPSAYEIYDSLKGKRMCHLPSGPCDNNERAQN
jgi:hypothetical protein